jgi:3'-phosphoadenosine 5'-phosphosulfate sulfotransferase (PAPS reductase)/FAD synthetase
MKMAKEASEILRESINELDPDHVYAAFSGGHDSLVATHIASKTPEFDGVFHANTGIGIEETREYVRETCKRHEWRLHEISPQDCKDAGYKGLTYEEMVEKYGFPGAAQHQKAYTYLKERPIRHLKRTVKDRRTEKVMLVTGIRSHESERRMGNAVEYHIGPEGIAWSAPLFYWQKLDVTKYIDEHDLQRNPVEDYMHMSGECLCGAYARPGEMEELQMWYPDAADQIKDLEAKIADKDAQVFEVDQFEEKMRKWGWTQRNIKNPAQKSLPMCHDCTQFKGDA